MMVHGEWNGNIPNLCYASKEGGDWRLSLFVIGMMGIDCSAVLKLRLPFL